MVGRRRFRNSCPLKLMGNNTKIGQVQTGVFFQKDCRGNPMYTMDTEHTAAKVDAFSEQ